MTLIASILPSKMAFLDKKKPDSRQASLLFWSALLLSTLSAKADCLTKPMLRETSVSDSFVHPSTAAQGDKR